MSVLQISRVIAAVTGRAVDLGGKHVYVEVEAGADCWVRAVETAEDAPSATPAPGADASAEWIHLGTAGDKTIFDLTKAGTRLGATRGIVQISIWSVAAGTHVITGPGF